MNRYRNMSTEELESLLDDVDMLDDPDAEDEIEAELDRREYDASDPAVQAGREDSPSLDPPWWEDR